MNIAERNARILEAIERQTRENCSSPEKARAYLISLGIYTEDGQLTSEYGGEPGDLAADQNPDMSYQLCK